MQIGKNGLTQAYLETIKTRFEDREAVKISVLKSARKSKKDVEKYAEEIVKFLGTKFTYRVLGFCIFLKKWRKERR